MRSAWGMRCAACAFASEVMGASSQSGPFTMAEHCSASCFGPAREEARQDLRHLRLHHIERLARIDEVNALGLLAGELKVRGAYAFEERLALCLEAIRRPGPCARTRKSQGDRQIQEQRAVGPKPRVHGRCKFLDEARLHTPAAALIGARSVGEAVADDPNAFGERGPNPIVEMNVAGGEHEQR